MLTFISELHILKVLHTYNTFRYIFWIGKYKLCTLLLLSPLSVKLNFIYFLPRFSYVYYKSLKRTLKPVFEHKITFWIFVLRLLIHKGYCLVKKLVWNVRIGFIDFWYTKINLHSDLVWEIQLISIKGKKFPKHITRFF